MALVRSEIVMGIVAELEMEMALGMPLANKLIGHVCLEEIHNV
jgi:hypothetical protein